MRIGGIASGMDTEQMIRDLMRVERVRVDRLLQQEQRVRWRQEAYNDINRNMANFILNTRMAFSGSERTITRSTVDRFDWVKSANSSNESVVRATATSSAMNGIHTIEVIDVAGVASVTTKNLNEMLQNGTFKEDFNGKEITIKTHASNETVTFRVGDSEDGKIGVKNINDLVRGINNLTVTEGTKTINLGLRAAFDSTLGQLMITTRETGQDRSIEIFGNLAEDMFHPDDYTRLSTGMVKGKDAKIKFNGSEEVISRPTNNFSVFGINLQLQSVSPPNTSVTIRVDANVDGIYNKIDEFVKSYNQMLDEINGLIGQKFYRDFPPLTDEQKTAMSEDDIKKWEERARSGLLRQDEGLTRIIQSMRSSIYNPVKDVIGQFSHISNIGITTGTFQDGGKLVINEDRLRSAIANDPEGVVNLLFKTSDTVIPNNGTPEEIRTARQNRANETGIIQRIYDDMITGMKDIIRRSGHGGDASLFRTVQSNMLIDFVTRQSSISVIERDLSSISRRVAREEQILIGREDRYWRQFSAMEKAMNQMHQQGSWLMAQLGMGQ